MSLLPFFESRGAVYRSGDTNTDALQILKTRGLNCVRLRLFTSSAAQAAADPYNRINNLDYTVPLAVRVKQAGLRWLLDFHYSDTWADPGHQSKPVAWQNLSFPELVSQVRSYSSNCLAAFRTAGALPDYVQVGNEITSGLLWPDGHVGGTDDTPSQWAKFAQLLNAAVAGVRDGAGTGPQLPIMIHIDRGGDWNGTRWFFDHLLANQVAFDLIGESYYPFWHGSPADLSRCLTNAATRYAKPLVVAETAFPWTGSTNIYGIPATPAGQVQFVGTLAQIVNSVPNHLGAGIIWWGSEYERLPGVPTAGFDQKSLYDASGNVLPVAGALGQLLAPLILSPELTNGILSLQWPFSGAGMHLTFTTNLREQVWSPVAGDVRNADGVLSLALPWNRDKTSFYRLQSN